MRYSALILAFVLLPTLHTAAEAQDATASIGVTAHVAEPVRSERHEGSFVDVRVLAAGAAIEISAPAAGADSTHLLHHVRVTAHSAAGATTIVVERVGTAGIYRIALPRDGPAAGAITVTFVVAANL